MKQKVVAKPYGLHFVGPQTSVASRKDTPTSDFLGTVVLLLHDSSDRTFEMNREEIRIDKDKNVVLFCADTGDQLTKLTKGCRCTLTFDIYKREEEEEEEKQLDTRTLLASLEKLVENTPLRTLGFLLFSSYISQSKDYQNVDKAFVFLLEQLDPKEWSIEHSPVLVLVQGQYDHDDFEPKFRSLVRTLQAKVYPCSDEEFQTSENKWSKLGLDYLKMPFVSLLASSFRATEEDHCWENQSTGGEYTGNEDTPYDINSLYLHDAIILKKRNE